MDLTISTDFDSADFSKVGRLPKNYNWNIVEESDWTLPQMEFLQYRASTIDKTLHNLLENPLTFPEGTPFNFEVNWPYSLNEPLPSKLSCSYHVYAFKLLFSNGYLDSFQRLCQAKLIDLARPIYDESKRLYRSFLSLAIDYNRKIEEPKFDLLLSYTPKLMLNHPDSKGVLPLTAAIRQNRLDLVRKLVEAGADINRLIGGNFRTPFMSAIEYNHKDIVGYLWDTGKVDPNSILPDGTSAFYLICIHNPTEFLNYLRKFMAGPIILSHQAFSSAIHQLYRNKNPLLSEAIAPVVYEQHPLLQSLIALAYTAASYNDLDILRMLHGFNVPLNSYTTPGVMPIHAAAAGGFTDIVMFLLATGTDINAATASGLTPIQIAYNSCHYDLACELIKLVDDSALDYVVQRAISTDNRQIIAALLTRNPLDLTLIAFPNDYNPITWAIIEDKPQILIMMLRTKKASISNPDRGGRTIFNMKLSSVIRHEITELLKEKYASLRSGSSIKDTE